MSINNILKTNKGYSMIEVMVSLVISSFIILSTVTTLSNLMVFNRKAQVTAEVTQNMQYSVETLKRNIRQVSYSDFLAVASIESGSFDNVCDSLGNKSVSSGHFCGTKLIGGTRHPVFRVYDYAIFITDNTTGKEIRLTPTTVWVTNVDVKLDEIALSNSEKTLYVSLEISAVDSENILLEFSDETQNEQVTIKTGVFLRRDSSE